VRAVLDVNIIISAVLSANGAPARVLAAWQHGALELVVSPLLLAELERALAYPKLRQRIPPDEAEELIAWLRSAATVADDPTTPAPIRSPDPGGDYLLSLAATEKAAIVSGDAHLLSLEPGLPIFSAATFLELLEQRT